MYGVLEYYMRRTRQSVLMRTKRTECLSPCISLPEHVILRLQFRLRFRP